MKMFVAPEVEIIVFDQKDAIVTSTCDCVECTPCPEKDHCPYDL